MTQSHCSHAAMREGVEIPQNQQLSGTTKDVLAATPMPVAGIRMLV